MSLSTVQRQFYSLAEFAEIFGLDIKTIRRYIAEGRVKAFRIGGAIRIPMTEVEHLATANPVGNSQA